MTSTSTCPACNGTLIAGIKFCPHCGHPVSPGQPLSAQQPAQPGFPPLDPPARLVIPFDIDQDSVRKKAATFLRRHVAAPSDIGQAIDEAEITALLVPTWSISGNVVSSWTAEVGIKQAQNRYSWSLVAGDHQAQYTDRLIAPSIFNKLPVYMRYAVGVAARQLSRAVPCEEAHLHGVQLFERQIATEAAQERALQELGTTLQKECSGLIPSRMQRNLRVNSQFQDVKADEVLLPCWKIAFRAAGKNRVLYADGVGGRIFGETITSATKVAWMVGIPVALGILLIVGAILIAFPYLGVFAGLVGLGVSVLFFVNTSVQKLVTGFLKITPDRRTRIVATGAVSAVLSVLVVLFYGAIWGGSIATSIADRKAEKGRLAAEQQAEEERQARCQALPAEFDALVAQVETQPKAVLDAVSRFEECGGLPGDRKSSLAQANVFLGKAVQDEAEAESYYNQAIEVDSSCTEAISALYEMVLPRGQEAKTSADQAMRKKEYSTAENDYGVCLDHTKDIARFMAEDETTGELGRRCTAGLDKAKGYVQLQLAKQHKSDGDDDYRDKNWAGASSRYASAIEVAEKANTYLGNHWEANSVISQAQKKKDSADSKEKKRQEEEQAERELVAALKAVCGSAPTVDAWDGGIVAVDSFMKQSAHDRKSIDSENCTTPVLTDNCWKTTCTVRGKNAFGALIANTYTFYLAADPEYSALHNVIDAREGR